MKNNVLTVFWHGLVCALIIAMPTFPADGKLNLLMFYGVIATMISYFLTHMVMLLPLLKSELSEHFKWNMSDAFSTLLFAVINAAGVYLVQGLTNHTTITLNAFISVIWGAIIYGIKSYAENSNGQIKVEPDMIFKQHIELPPDKTVDKISDNS